MGADRARRPLAAGEISPYQRLLLDRVAAWPAPDGSAT